MLITFNSLLVCARSNDVRAQRTLLLILNLRYSNSHEFYHDFEKLTDEDLCDWIIPLAMQLNVPAVKVVRFGMLTERCRFWTEDFFDEETNEIVELERSETIDGETYFTRDEVLLHYIDGIIEQQLKTLPSQTLHELFVFLVLTSYKVIVPQHQDGFVFQFFWEIFFKYFSCNIFNYPIV